jgi:hypothetical protein
MTPPSFTPVNPEDASLMNGRFAPGHYLRGMVLGRSAAGLLQPVSGPPSIHVITPSAAASAGTFTLSIMRPTGIIGTTAPLAHNASIAAIQSAMDSAGGIPDGIVASSAGSAAPFSTPTPLILTYSGTAYDEHAWYLATVDTSNLIGAIATVVTRDIPAHTITIEGGAAPGRFVLGIPRPDGTFGYTGPIAGAPSLAAIQAAVDLAAGVAGAVVVSFPDTDVIQLTYSGATFLNRDLPLATVKLGSDVTFATKVTVEHATFTADGTEIPVGFSQYEFVADSEGRCNMDGLAWGTQGTGDKPRKLMTMPYWIKGTFRLSELVGWREAFYRLMNATKINSEYVRVP